MSSFGWTIDEKSEDRHLFPWLATEPDPFLRLAVLLWVARLGREPIGRSVEERPGLFAARVPRTSVGVIWTLDVENRRVILARIGSLA